MERETWFMRKICFLAARYYLKRPDQAGLLTIKYPRLSDLWPAVMNELCFRLRLPFSHRLTGLNVELTNRCNLACLHCKKRGPDPRKERDMDFETFRRIVDQVPGLKTVLPFQWGEPLLSPILYDCIAYARRRGIRVMVTTNGVLLDEAAAERLIAAGLSRLTISFDGGRETHRGLRGGDPDLVLAHAALFKAVRDRMGASCALDASMVVDETTEPAMEEYRALFEGLADRIQFIPRFVKGRRTAPCRELWRGVLVVLSNGVVTTCCADEAGRNVIGNIAEETLPDLFNGEAMRRIRRTHRRRAFEGPCTHCAEYDSACVSPRFS